jgi:hypothetical protein
MNAAPLLSKALAEATLEAVKVQFAVYIEAGYGPPTLAEPGQWSSGWSVVWESGPDEWAHRAFIDGTDEEVFFLAMDEGLGSKRAREIAKTRTAELPKGVSAEPYNSFILALYPSE